MKLTRIVLLITSSFLFTLFMQSCTLDANANSKNISSPAMATKLVWHKIEDMENLVKADPKPVLVDVYTDWCKWCKVMDQQTFNDPSIIQYLNENFHMVKFNAEQNETINFKGESYDFRKNGRRGYNDLARALLKGSLSYPSIVILDADLNHLKVVKGFKAPDAFKSSISSAI